MEIRIEVENIRCGGCANSITKKLMDDERIESVNVDIENQTVILESAEDIKEDATKLLLGLGYPEKGSVEGIEALKGKAKSVVSCAIGKVT